MKTKANHIDYISFASVIASVAVIFLHTNEAFWNFSLEKYWISANVIESVFYFAVPVFFMITGATLMNYQERYNTVTFIKKRVTRTVIPYLSWSIIGLLFSMFYLQWFPLEDLTLKYLINGLLQGKLFVSVYWFFIPLFSVYLSIPLFASIPKEKRTAVFSYLAVLTFIFNFVIPFFVALSKRDIQYTFSLPSISGYLFYCIIGSLIAQNHLKPLARWLIYLLALSGLLVHLFGTYMLSIEGGSIDSTFKGYLNLPCVVYSVGAFVFLKYAGQRLMMIRWIQQLISFLDNYTFPFYLVHLFVHYVLIKEFSINHYSLSYRLLAPFIIMVVVIPFAWLLRKIPFIKKILP